MHIKRTVAATLAMIAVAAPATAAAATMGLNAAADGTKIVTVAWFNESFSTTLTATGGVQMATPRASQVCKFYPRIGNRCLTVVTGGANYYTAFSGDYSTADVGQCVAGSTYVSGYGYAPQLPVSCVGNLGATTGFLVSFAVVGSGAVKMTDGTTLAIP